MIFTASLVGFFTVSVSVTSPFTFAESVAGSSLLGRTFTGGVGGTHVGPQSVIVIDACVPCTLCTPIAIACGPFAVLLFIR